MSTIYRRTIYWSTAPLVSIRRRCGRNTSEQRSQEEGVEEVALRFSGALTLPDHGIEDDVLLLPRPFPIGCVNAGQRNATVSPVFGLPDVAKRVQYPLMAE